MADHERFLRDWIKAQPAVAGFVSALVPDFHAAEDILQEVAVVLLRKYGEYDSSRPFLPWALGIARLEVLNRRRALARGGLAHRPSLAEKLEAACGELAPELERRTEALRECLKGVEGRAREVLRLRYELALGPREIAGRVGISGGAVRVLLSRVRAALRDCIRRRMAAEGGAA